MSEPEDKLRRFRIASRIGQIEPFFVMEILDRAYRLQHSGRSIIHLEVGEPDFPTPEPVVAAGIEALRSGHTKYTPALGLPELRALIAESYPAPARPSWEQIAVTPGSSGALQVAFAVLLDPGDEVLLADPGYPCNRNMIRLYGARPRDVPVGPDSNYQLTAELIRNNWTLQTRVVLLASPSNPTGTVVPPSSMREIAETVADLGGVLLVDEIYHGLVYETEVRTVLHETQSAWVINSFSKYYGMTGWRVGWMVVPDGYMDAVNRLAQNLFISTNAPAQHAALRAFDTTVVEELERRRDEFRARRDYLVPALRSIGFGIPLSPEGAFYVYADCSGLCDDSEAFTLALLEQAGVAITPGRDFGAYRAGAHVRFSYANTLDKLQQAVARLEDFLQTST